jgi:hypothetical protein
MSATLPSSLPIDPLSNDHVRRMSMPPGRAVQRRLARQLAISNI